MLFKNVKIKSKTVLAPLAGVSDQPFRLLCKSYGAGLMFSEMVSADGLVHGNAPTLGYCRFQEYERPFGVQIFGNDPVIMAQATRTVSEFQPDFIDLNAGCPVPKVVKRGAGAALLKDLKLLREIILAMTENTAIPILVKIRSGWGPGDNIAVEVAQMVEACGAKGITVHPRTQAMKFRGKSDWRIIRQVKEQVHIPVIGNGDILTPQDALRMLDETGCDLIMLGRAVFGRPWFFEQVNTFLDTGQLIAEPDFVERLDICRHHLSLAVELMSERYAVMDMRKHIAWYTRGMPGSTKFRSRLFNCNRLQNVEKLLAEYRTYLQQRLRKTSGIEGDKPVA